MLSRAPRRWSPERRWLISPLLALLVVLALFWLMQHVLSSGRSPGVGETEIEGISVVQAKPDEQPKSDEDLFKPESAPPPPPAAPPALAQPNMPSIAMPTMAVASVDTGSISVPVNLVGGGTSLGSIGSFGGFASGGGNGRGAGGGGNGYGGGQGFKGKPLIPLATARPQMPEWACKQKIKGWVEAVFTVMPDGHVRDVKIVDASPRGVYEAAAVESISHWIYAQSDRAREVQQRVEMDPADCIYNWQG